MRDIFARPIPLSVNGRFLTQPETGVQRSAWELTKAIDELMSKNESLRERFTLQVLRPRRGARQLPLKVGQERALGVLSGQAWEQLELARAASGSILLCFANMSPVAAKRTVLMVHDAQVYDTPGSYPVAFRAWYRWAQPLMAKRAGALLTVSNYSADRLAAQGLAPRPTWSVVPNGCDHIARTQPDLGVVERLGLKPFVYATMMASKLAHKNVGVVLRAMRKPALADRTLVLYGSDADDLAQSIPNAISAGRLDDASMAGLLAQAGCFAFPSFTEGFGFPALEALSCGAPVVAARAGATPEVLGNAARYANPGDEEVWARELSGLLSLSPDARKGIAEAGRQRAECFTWEQAARGVLKSVDGLGCAR